MRLRIQTLSPLPELKAWFIPELQDAHDTVFYLKELLCQGIPKLRTNKIHSRNLVLLLEGFELLNDSPISAVRDGDLIVVKTSQHTKERVDMSSELPSQSRKRKRQSNEFDRSPGKISSKSAAIRQVFSTLQKVSQSTVSDDSSSDSESNTSDSSSDSSSSASSSDSSLPVNNILGPPKPGKLQRRAKEQSSKTTHVPPGHGKPSTHSRNERRKKKREHDKLAKATLPKGLSETNNLPLGPTQTEEPSSAPLSAPLLQSSTSNEANLTWLAAHDNTSTPHENDQAPSSKYVYITPDQVMMGSLRNKNKKKGFKQAMSGPIAQKIVFSGEVEQAQLHESNPVLGDHAPQNLGDDQFSEVNRPFHRLVPPSELQDLGQLPPNVFVTSVDVEEHIWDPHGGLPKKNKGMKRKSKCDYGDGGGFGFQNRGQGEGRVYGEASGETLVPSTGIDWNKAEKLWEASSPIQDIRQFTDGVVFGWKELAINPQTFTPEVLLVLARVITNTHEGTDSERNIADVRIRFRRLRRGSSEAAVAFGVAADGDEDAEGGDMEEEEESATWSDVLAGQWRIVNM